ncbi:MULTISPECIES: sigma-70 family RNA polymerase sigma factor [Flammeovirga]|uniref:Sigma-70 family RNA polymerase sigma factor n=1 Tax=Flammeovirga agarivorans TaxID=2726742 RepID=A0A7X8SGK8_9BACT|nr:MULTISPECIES: sigma-70 family RNA polymerase sigma factor [Flammeovirga]NLR89753.1 sigma-70 family RNA polymerase sigma factor [Flammeovirga agarivorans]
MEKNNITQILNNKSDLDRSDKIYPLVYDNLHLISEKLFQRERVGHTLQPTLLVNEAFMNLVDNDNIEWQGKTHFYAMGARAIRRILVDHARSKNTSKRGGDWHKIDLEKVVAFHPEKGDMALALDEAIEHLAEKHERQAKVVEMKFFGGMKMKEIADELGVSIKTIEVDWTVAKQWIKIFLTKEV